IRAPDWTTAAARVEIVGRVTDRSDAHPPAALAPTRASAAARLSSLIGPRWRGVVLLYFRLPDGERPQPPQSEYASSRGARAARLCCAPANRRLTGRAAAALATRYTRSPLAQAAPRTIAVPVH